MNRVKTVWSAEELIAKLEEHDINISKRTLLTDIEDMRFDERLGYRAPIQYSKGRGGYYYEKDGYSINALNLSEEDIQTLVFARDFIRPYLNLKVLKNFEPILEKIILCSHHAALLSADGIPTILTDNKFGCKLDQVNMLIEAIREKIVVRITIQSLIGAGEKQTFLFHPYWLHQVDAIWFFGGLMDDPFDKKIGFFQLEQLELITPSVREYVDPEV